MRGVTISRNGNPIIAGRAAAARGRANANRARFGDALFGRRAASAEDSESY